MLFAHQAGSVKVGEVIRYTLTYTPLDDRILPSPSQLYVRIKNTSAIPLRAAYLHGPYTLHVSAYPSNFNPNKKLDDPRRYGVPQFEPNLKAGGHWHAEILVPDYIREQGDKDDESENGNDSPRKITWIIEISSQILFSNTASVHFELLIARDQRSLDIGFAAIASMGHGEPGKVFDARSLLPDGTGPRSQSKGVYSRAVDLMVEDTAALWDKPALPRRSPVPNQRPTSTLMRSFSKKDKQTDQGSSKQPNKQKKIHLVILTHGLHSNLGADLLYLKESIDNAVKEAREERRISRKRNQPPKNEPSSKEEPTQKIEENENSEDDEEEEVIVRGFPGNAVRTERGIQYLGKRLAKYIMTLTYPDQPFLPPSRSLSRSFTGFGSSGSKASKQESQVQHPNHPASKDQLPYTFTQISLIGHSLGGLIQTYAIAYIHKHSPGFFDKIKPANFVTLAAPLLGLSNENPMYVKFALDFGLVGRTGQDLGLTWRAPNIARTGWSAMISGFGGNDTEEQPKKQDPRSKPLLRILPSGPAHQILKKFRNRTVYSNVVNDGIVPLRTSCLLFLDWRGLDRVENARRENGLIGTMASFGWAELTGANASSHRPSIAQYMDQHSQESGSDNDNDPSTDPIKQPGSRRSTEPALGSHQLPSYSHSRQHSYSKSRTSSRASNNVSIDHGLDDTKSPERSDAPSNAFEDFLNFFRGGTTKQQPVKAHKPSTKVRRAYTRAQVVPSSENLPDSVKDFENQSKEGRPKASRGDSLMNDPKGVPPPTTSIFEAAGDILNPPLPDLSWITDPSTRPQTIFHDRIYHPEDIPPPSSHKKSLIGRSFTTDGRRRSKEGSSKAQDASTDGTGMKVEERIARAYHRDLSWRKVLVRLEPDAHNNMIVRRIFANAYGWDVVKHLCDTHFSNSFAATTNDDDEPTEEHAEVPSEQRVGGEEETKNQTTEIQKPAKARRSRTKSEMVELSDVLSDLEKPQHGTASMASGGSAGSLTGSHSSKGRISTPRDSVEWSDSVFEGSEDDEDSEDEVKSSPREAWRKFWAPASPNTKLKTNLDPSHNGAMKSKSNGAGTSDAEIADFLTQSPTKVDGHRGIGIIDSALSDDAVSKQQPALPKQNSPKEASAMSGDSTELGMRKPIQERIDTSGSVPSQGKDTSPRPLSVSEQIARLSIEKKD